jgi:hypothetical protein
MPASAVRSGTADGALAFLARDHGVLFVVVASLATYGTTTLLDELFAASLHMRPTSMASRLVVAVILGAIMQRRMRRGS